MILRVFLLFLAFLSFNSALQANVWDNITGYFKREKLEPPTIRVLILHDVEGANLQVLGKYSLYDPYTNSHISSRFSGKNRYIQALSDGLKWGEAFPGLYQIKIQPKELAMRTMINGNEYEGSVYIYDIGGALSAVNQVPVEDYVRSVLSVYADQDLESETLAALAIVARTNAYFQAAHPKNTYWAVDAQKVGYPGVALLPSQLEEAIEMTRYMIMSRTGVYEGIATPFAAQMDAKENLVRDVEIAKISLEEANEMAQKGAHAAQILAKAFPHSPIMLMQYSK